MSAPTRVTLRALRRPFIFVAAFAVAGTLVVSAVGSSSGRPTLVTLDGVAGTTAPIVETVTHGNWKAAFSYTEGSAFGFGYSHLWLTITVRGRVIFSQQQSLWPARKGHSLSISDLDHDGIPEVVVHSFSGGAHCCFVLAVYRLSGGRIHEADKNFASSGFRAVDLDRDGTNEFVGADPRFEYLLTDYADSYSPIRISAYRHGVFVTVTGKYRAAIRKDERRAWKFYLTDRGNSDLRGVLAAWAADKYMLREGIDVWPAIEQAVDSGYLDGYGAPDGIAYPAALRHQLAKFGYLKLR
jgi:hypothetical protein